MISVIVCTYNQERTIARTLDSILRQVCDEEVEIVIGEDHSSDATLCVCQQYAAQHPNILLFQNASNKGLLNNYFDCILAAHGEYIADLAGDDEWCDDHKLQKELDVMRSHPEVVLVHTNYQLRSEQSGVISEALPYQQPTALVEGRQLTEAILTQRSRPVVHLCTALYRKQVFMTCYEQHTELFRNDTYPCEDLQLCALMAQHGSFYYIDQPTLLYSIGGESITADTNHKRQFNFVAGATQLVFDLQQALSFTLTPRLQAHYSHRCYELLMHAMRAHDAALRATAIKKAKQWNAPLGLRHRYILALTSCEALWNLTLLLRSIFVRCKHLPAAKNTL